MLTPYHVGAHMISWCKQVDRGWQQYGVGLSEVDGVNVIMTKG